MKSRERARSREALCIEGRMVAIRCLSWSLATPLLVCAAAVAQHFEYQTPWAGCSVAFDSVRGRLVAFGGQKAVAGSAGGWTDRTWEFDGSGWSLSRPAVRPPARSLAAMAFDPVRNRTVLFGGDPLLGDTWLFDGATWSQVTTPVAPSPRAGAKMTFDAARGRMVLVGGSGLAGPGLGTWEFDGTTWTASPAVTPSSPTVLDAIAFDAARSLVVGFRPAGFGSETWQYDGATWTLTGSAPGLVVAAATRHNGPGITALIDTTVSTAAAWDFDGATWSPSASGAITSYGILVHDAAASRLLCVDGENNVLEIGAASTRFLMPPVRHSAGLAFDSSRGCAVLFGGSLLAGMQTGVGYQDTWELRGGTWTQVFPGTNPGGRWGHAMAYDSRRARSVLVGGSGPGPGPGPFADTWAFDGTNWTMISAAGPSARSGHAMVYDPVRDRIVLFGGVLPGPVTVSDTWEFDGTTWTHVVTATTPTNAGLDAPRMTFDSRRGVAVLVDAGSIMWEFDGSDWSMVVTPTNPRIVGGLGYDVVRGRVVAQGGPYMYVMWVAWADTLEYDGIDWVSVGGHLESPVTLIYDTVRKQMIGTAGGGRTITYELPTVASFSRHGLGCPGSAGTPSLDTTQNTTPALGTTFPLHLTSLPTTPSFAYVTFGFDLATWNGIPLPIDLAAIGMPNCQLWVEPLVGALLPTTAGAASFSLAIPAQPALAGQILGAQALSFDTMSPSGFAATSNGAILRMY